MICARRLATMAGIFFLWLFASVTAFATDEEGVWVRKDLLPAMLNGRIVARYEFFELNNGRISNGYAGVEYPEFSSLMCAGKPPCMGERYAVQFTGNYELTGNPLTSRAFGNTLHISNLKSHTPLIDRKEVDETQFRPAALLAQCCQFDMKIDGRTAHIDVAGETRTYLQFTRTQFDAVTALASSFEVSFFDFGQCIVKGSHDALAARKNGKETTHQRELLTILDLVSFEDGLNKAVYEAHGKGKIDTNELDTEKSRRGRQYRQAKMRKFALGYSMGELARGGTLSEARTIITDRLFRKKPDEVDNAVLKIIESLEPNIRIANRWIKAMGEGGEGLPGLARRICPGETLPKVD